MCAKSGIRIVKNYPANTCSKPTIETLERRQKVVLGFLLLTLNIFHTFFSVYTVDFEQVSLSWI